MLAAHALYVTPSHTIAMSGAGAPPPGYVCRNCGQAGHFRHQCGVAAQRGAHTDTGQLPPAPELVVEVEHELAGGEIAEALDGRIEMTLDPTERHGFEYQSWIGFSIFASGVRGEIGRGGSYTVLHEGGAEEPAIGFSLYPDAIVDGGLSVPDRRRLFVLIGTDPALAAAMRAEGWVTVAQLAAGDSPEAQLCTHVLTGGDARLV